jgi:hypothetical protein
MGMYKELIFAAKLKVDTPEFVISTLKYMLGETDPPHNLDFDEGVFAASSYYFPVSKALNDFFHDGDNWVLSHRGNYKNCDNQGFIEKFLDWIKPFIECGSSWENIYAITIYEDSHEAKIHSLGA